MHKLQHHIRRNLIVDEAEVISINNFFSGAITVIMEPTVFPREIEEVFTPALIADREIKAESRRLHESKGLMGSRPMTGGRSISTSFHISKTRRAS